MVVTGFDVSGVLHHRSPLEAQLQATHNIVPAYTWYASPHGAFATRFTRRWTEFATVVGVALDPSA
jgi:hypothetical protein